MKVDCKFAQWSPKNGLCHVFSTCNGGQGSHKQWRTWLKVCGGKASNFTVTPSLRGLRSVLLPLHSRNTMFICEFVSLTMLGWVGSGVV